MIGLKMRQSLSSKNQAASTLTPFASKEDERREFEAVSAALGNSSRLLRLMTYIGKSTSRVIPTICTNTTLQPKSLGAQKTHSMQAKMQSSG